MKHFARPALNSSDLPFSFSRELPPVEETILNRSASLSQDSSSHGLQVDNLLGQFVDQATDWKSIAAMTAGGLAYRFGKIGVLGVGAIRESPLLARPLSIILGLASEVTAFEFTNRTLLTLSPHPPSGHPLPEGEGNSVGNYWNWSGPGGWKEGLLQSFITFGALKGFGRLASSENIVLQHGFQDLGMMLGHQLVSRAGMGPMPEGTFAEQFLHAEVTNLQMGAGMALGHALTGGRILALEKGLDALVARGFSPALAALKGLATRESLEGIRGVLAPEGAAIGEKSPLLSAPLLAEMKGEGRGGGSKEIIIRSEKQELALQNLKNAERELYAHSSKDARAALAKIKALLPHLAEADRVELAVRVAERDDGIISQIRGDVRNFVVEVGLSLSPKSRLNLLKGLESGFQRGYEVGLNKIEMIAQILPNVEPQDRWVWVRPFVEMNTHGGYDQSRLASVFSFSAPLLPEGDRLALALAIAEKLEAKKYSVGTNLEGILPHLSETQRLDLALKLENYLQDDDAKLRRGAVDTLYRVISELNPADRPERVGKIEQRLNDEDYLVRRSAVEALRWIHPRLTEAERDSPVFKIVERLLGHEEKEWDHWVKKLELILGELSSEQSQALSDRVKRALKDDAWHFRRIALEIFIHLIPHLSQKDLPRLGAEIAKRMEDEQSFVRPSAVTALRQIARFVPETERLSWALRIEKRWIEDFKNLSYGGAEALKWIMSCLPEGDRATLARRVESRLDHGNPKIVENALEVLKTFLRYLTPRQRLPTLLLIAGKSWDENPGAQKTVRQALQEYLSTMEVSARLEFLKDMMERQGLSELNFEFVPLLLHRLSSQTLESYAQKQQNSGLSLLAGYHGSGLPFHEVLWRDYLQAKDRGALLRDLSAKVRRHRRGEAPRRVLENETLWAYFGLDSPEQLSFKAFAREIGTEAPGRPFLNRSFQAAVVERKSSFQRIDKGKVNEALFPLREVQHAFHLEKGIRKLLRSVPAPLQGIREDLQALATKLGLFPPPVASLLREIQKVLPALWGLRRNREVRELLLPLTLFMAWHRPGLEAQKAKIQTISSPRSFSSETFLEGVKSLEEFYQEGLDEAVGGLGIKAEELPFLRKQRRLLRAELERAQAETGEEALVEFLPSKNAADRFFGYVGEDCTKRKGEAIDRDDFQVTRMISKDRLVGMLYLQKKRVGWWKKALVVAIQPRSFWEVDQRSLLRAVEENLSRVAREEGYDFVLLMNSRNQQSNRQDMLAAIVAEGYPVLTLKEPISGAVFEGKEFLVLWKKGNPIRPAPSLVIPLPVDEAPEEPPEEEEEGEARFLAPIREEDPLRLEDGIELVPPGEVPPSVDHSSIPLEKRLRLLAEDEEDPVLRLRFRHLVQNRMSQVLRQLSVRQRRRMMQALTPEFLAEVRRAFQEVGLHSPFGWGEPGENPSQDQGLMKIPSAELARYGALAVRKNEILPPGTLVLRRRSLEAILCDPRVTRQDRGWFEPTLKGKKQVVEAGEVVGAEENAEALARGDEINVQELFDFYNVVFYQGYQFRGYLRLLQNRGAEIQPLARVVEGLSQNLDRGLEHLFSRRFQEALAVLQETDAQVTQFQQELRRIAQTVGLEIDPVTGMIYPRN